MTFDTAMQSFDRAADAIAQAHPELRELVRGARASAGRIAQRYAVDRDEGRADQELAGLLLDLGDAAKKQEQVQRDLPGDGVGGPPSFATLEAVRAQARARYGVADAGPGFMGALIEQGARSVAVRSGNRFINWLLEVFGGPTIDLNLGPVGVVSVTPWKGDPLRAAIVTGTAFVAVAWVSWRVLASFGGSRRAA